jgi:serine/threonine protein kinase
MLVDEAKIAVQLTHGNIAQTFDLGRVGETYYITMEYVDGADLYKMLRRASERELAMPLDVCAFVGKEISSALDHAHRKRDHVGKSLGIVHRDVSPQNVLVSYSGEVKLVDFGIAKATMKARQTAVGVIKGKYYYMSPEQAWGDPIDHRSDIFSAGIVLYEMITGQMLYLEEDLHKLLEMARSAAIAPPSTLRRGVPPQLERIVMHALAKVPGERYQSAGDLATDLERFLHAYSPVFTTSKLSALLRDVVGDPLQVPDDPGFESIEFRDGTMSTHPIDDAEVAHATDRDELRDENSMIFRIAELQKPAPAEPRPRPVRPPPPSPAIRPPSRPLPRQPAPRVTRATDALPALAPRPLPSIAKPGSLAASPAPARPVTPIAVPRVPAAKPRQAHEETRQLERAPANPLHDDTSGLLTPDGKKLAWDSSSTQPGEELFENIGDRTLVTSLPSMAGFMAEPTGDDADGPEATLITSMPTGFGSDDDATAGRFEPAVEPTMPARPLLRNAQPPAALSAKIHAPAVSELRKPRASRRTPPGGAPVAAPNLLQAIVGSQASEPMPAPRPLAMPPPMPPPHARPAPPPVLAPPAPAPPPAPVHTTLPYANGAPIPASPAYYADASGLPLGIPAPPAQQATTHQAGMDFPPYLQMQGQMQGMPGYVPNHLAPPGGYPPLSQQAPATHYPFPPPPPPLSLTNQLRLYEVDELPPQFRLGASRRRWLAYVVSGVLAVSVAAIATFLVIRSMRDTAAVLGTVRIDSVPASAEVLFDGTRLPGRTPMTIPRTPVGTRHTIRVELSHYSAHEEQIEIPPRGGEVSVMASLKPVADKIVVDSLPSNAEIRIDGVLRGRTPATISDVDRDSAKLLELRLKDYQPYQKSLQDITWPSDGRLKVFAKLVR